MGDNVLYEEDLKVPNGEASPAMLFEDADTPKQPAQPDRSGIGAFGQGAWDRLKQAGSALVEPPRILLDAIAAGGDRAGAIGRSKARTAPFEQDMVAREKQYGWPYTAGKATTDVAATALLPQATPGKAALSMGLYNTATTPGELEDRAMAGGAGVVTGYAGAKAAHELGRGWNAYKGKYRPGNAELIAQDMAEAQRSGVGLKLRDYFPPSGEMEDFAKVMASNSEPNRILEVLATKKAEILGEGKRLFGELDNIVGANKAIISINPTETKAAVQNLYKHFGNSFRNIQDAESVATLSLLAGDTVTAAGALQHVGRVEALKALGDTAPKPQIDAYARQWARNAVIARKNQLDNMSFDSMWKMHKDIGNAVGALGENASPALEKGLKKIYGAIYKDLEQVSGNKTADAQINAAMKRAVDYYRDTVMPWTSGVTKDGGHIPILYQYARGRYTAAPKQAAADVASATSTSGVDRIVADGLTPEQAAVLTHVRRSPKQAKAYAAGDPDAGRSIFEHPFLRTVDAAADFANVSTPMWAKRWISGANPSAATARLRNLPAGGLNAMSREQPNEALWGGKPPSSR